MNITIGKKSPEDVRAVVKPRDEFGRTVKFLKLHRCKGCSAQTTNDYCVKCVKQSQVQSDERIFQTVAELLVISDMPLNYALAGAHVTEDMLYGKPSANIPKGILNA